MDTASLESNLIIKASIRSAKIYTLDPEILLLGIYPTNLLWGYEMTPLRGNSLQHHKSESVETTKFFRLWGTKGTATIRSKREPELS